MIPDTRRTETGVYFDGENMQLAELILPPICTSQITHKFSF